MAFCTALKLVLWLEGGESRNPDDPGGDTKDGITQSTWHRLGNDGSVLLATPGELAQCYRALWDSMRIRNPEAGCMVSLFDALPEPADAVAFQCFINLPWDAFVKLVQTAIGTVADGVLGPHDWAALQKQKGMDLADRLLTEQEKHYTETAKPEFINGLLNRVKKVDAWLCGKGEQSEVSKASGDDSGDSDYCCC